jgi:M6 family metalloprotease-like protein
MSPPSMPGFTAEFSAYKTHGHYRMTASPTNQPVVNPDVWTLSPPFCGVGVDECGAPDVGFFCCSRERPRCCVDSDNPLFLYSCCPANDPECCQGVGPPGPCPGGALLCGNRCCPPSQYCVDTRNGICCPIDTVFTQDGCCDPSRVCGNRCCGPFDTCCNGRECCPPGRLCSPVDGCCEPSETLCCGGKCCPPIHPGDGCPWTNYPSLNSAPVASKWLVVECQFADVPAIPAGLDTSIRQFLGPAGTGYGNIVDYFHDLSYNRIAFSADFIDWVRVPFKSTEISSNAERAERVRRCLEAIPANKVPDFRSYYGVIAISNAPSDDGACAIGQLQMTINGQRYSLACDWFAPGSLFTAFAAHEIGHAFGLGHSYDNTKRICPRGGSPTGEYCDPWDIMSAFVTYQFDSRNFRADGFGAGPGMSAPNLLRMGWIPNANQRTFQPDGGEQIFTIRALSHPQADQPLVVLLDIGFLPLTDVYTVEYRQGDGWDLGIVSRYIGVDGGPPVPPVPQSQGGAVLVHQYQFGGNSPAVLIETSDGGAIPPGKTLVLTSPVSPDDVYHVTVKSIDTLNATAIVSIGPGRG